ncbi:MAG: OmpA family protein [bacterium]
MRSLQLIVLAAALILCACSAPPELSHSVCEPPPPPECKPGLSMATSVDTSGVQPDHYKYYIQSLPTPINSSQNENAFSVIRMSSENLVLLSAERNANTEGKQEIYFSALKTGFHFDSLSKVAGVSSYEQVGCVWYCEPEQRLYFSAKAINDDANDYDILSAQLIKNSTSYELRDVQPVAKLNLPISFDAQPALSPDGLAIVFASDRVGGKGGVDLWLSTRSSVGSSWGEPHSLGAEVNTPCNELSPFFSTDGKILYFSSDGHETIGGYDIFSAERTGTGFKPAKNIGYPLNTKSDEIFPCVPNDSQFFYTSDQPCNFKGRNIFVMRRTFVPNADIITHSTPLNEGRKIIPDSVELKGTVELPAHHDAELPEVFVRDVEKDKEIARKPTDTAGNYSFQVQGGRLYDVGSEKKDKFYDVKRVDLTHPSDSIVTVPKLIIPDTLILRINFPFDDNEHPYDFTYDEQGVKSDTRWQTSLDLLAKSIASSSSSLEKVILYGHTDSLGTDEYNLGLAKRRAEFVARELRKRGIATKLLNIISKGRALPLTRSAGESDEVYQLRCRRVEFVKIFSKVKTQ